MKVFHIVNASRLAQFVAAPDAATALEIAQTIGHIRGKPRRIDEIPGRSAYGTDLSAIIDGDKSGPIQLSAGGEGWEFGYGY